MRFNRAWQQVAIVGALAVVGAACGGAEESDSEATGTPTAGTEISVAADPSDDGNSTPDDGDSTAADACTDTLRIGMLNPTSGVYASIAEEIKRGFELYLDQNGGQLGGRQVELIVEDTEANPEVAVRAASKLINEDEVEFVTGIISSAVALAVAEPFTEAEIPMVISNGVGTILTGEDHSPFLFRVSISGWQGSYPAAQWMFDNWGEAAYTSAPDYAAGQDFAASFAAGWEDAGGTLSGQQFPPFTQTQDYQPYLSEIRSSGADSVYAFYAGAEAVSVVNQYAQFGLAEDIPLMGAISLVSNDVLDAQGEAAIGVHTLRPWSTELDNETNQAFIAAYDEAHGDATMGYAAPFSYDAAQLIGQALARTDGCTDDRQAVVEAMEGAEIDSPRGPLTIDAETHGTVQTMYVMEVQEVDGELVHVPVEDLGVWGEQPGSGPAGN